MSQNGQHFNVDSCRACAAFFRRSVMMEKRYVCRQGKNNCPISIAVRCICRKCRLRRCLDAGMVPESVQGARDPIILKSSDTEPLSACGSSIYSNEIEVDEIMASFQKILRVHKANMPANGEFVSEVFPEFKTLKEEEKWILLKHCVLVLWTLDAAFRTYKRVPTALIGIKW